MAYINGNEILFSAQVETTGDYTMKGFVNLRNCNYLFQNCTTMKNAPISYDDTENGTNFNSMFEGCTSLIEAPDLNTKKAESMNAMFYECANITEIPQYETQNVTNFGAMFYGCSSLKTVPALDVRKAIALTGMFMGCSALTDVWLKNIRVNLTVGSGETYGHLIKLECLLHLIKEVIYNESTAIKLTVGSANMAKLEGIYVKFITVTDEMRAEDEFIDNKYPFEVCESTDTGAMTIAEYVASKNITLQ